MDSIAMRPEGSRSGAQATPLRRSGPSPREGHPPYPLAISPSRVPDGHGHRSSGPSRNYAFPPPSHEVRGAGSTRTSPASTLPPRVSLSAAVARSRRASPLMHEIQPPNRRLSSHQMLLLTPFGAVLPAGVLPSAGITPLPSPPSAGMCRGSTNMGRTPSRSSAAMAPSSSAMGRDAPPPAPSSGHMTRQFTRRHQSLANPHVGPSPLASAPMTTIASVSDHESGSSGAGSAPPSREPSHGEGDRVPSLVGGFPGTVPMTRSSSLPVMTLRELQALEEKDGELGIARGGGWAWVSHEEEDEGDDEPHYTPASTARASLSTVASTTPPGARSLYPFTAFNDPFAPAAAGSSGMQRDLPATDGQYHPTATEPGYHYSPTHNDTRRMSEAPSVPSPIIDTSAGRRPSAPGPSSSSARTARTIHTTPPFTESASLGPSPRTSRGGSVTLGRAAGRGSVASIASGKSGASVSPQRPKITRYKSLPGRQEGLGLEIVVRKGTSGPSSERRESESSGYREIDHNAHAGGLRRSSRTRVSGSWAAVDVIDSLVSSDLASSTATSVSPLSSGRPSIHSISPTTAGPISADNLLMVEEITTRAHLAEFGSLGRSATKGKERARFDSIDSATLTHASKGAGAYVAQLAQSGWNATFPRRGSLAVLSRTALGPWAVGNGLAGLGLGDKDRVVAGGGAGGAHWSDRRGSWAEGWSKA